MTTAPRTRPTVAIIGAGAAGTLVALHLVRTAGRRSTGVDVILLDPADRWGRGPSFGTLDDQHLLNVPAAGMSALPEDPAHFVAWRTHEDPENGSDPATFARRREYARYLDETLTETLQGPPGEFAAVRHVRSRAVGLRRTGSGVVVATSDGRDVAADAAVVATGLPAAGHAWAPEALRGSAFFVPDPWAPGALDPVRRDRSGPGDVLLVGTGLTMVDVTLSLTDASNRPDRVVRAISRNARLPRAHVTGLKLAAIPDVSDWGSSLAEIRDHVTQHLQAVERDGGDWRPGVDGLRFRISTLWGRLNDEDRAEFLASDAGAWNVLRHRMPPSSATLVESMREAGRLVLSPGSVVGAEPLPRGGLRVTVADRSSDERDAVETTHDVGWVVNCTGPQGDVRLLGDPFLDDLLRPRGGASSAVVSTAGMGFRTDGGRLIDSEGRADAPVWTLGALRRGELWESTAVPEIRSQALAVATGVLDAIAPLPRRLADGRVVSGHHPAARPRDPLGLPISTTAEAATAYNAGLERLMRLQDDADAPLREAVALDPGFALGHATLALLGHEAGADADVQASLDAAREAVRQRGDERERSLVDVVGQRVKDVRNKGARALMNHIAAHPRDILAVSAAVPTIAFSGVTDVQQEAWDLVEGLAPAYGDHWWYISLLAFTRQDQSRFEEAGLLAESALSCEPSSGHAVHAQTHVMYETGQHEAGRVWLDHWVNESGRSASHRAHFSWHAALHELAIGDTEAVRRRYYSQLAPPTVSGVRALVDSASLLWRWQLTTSGWDAAVADGVPGATGTAFVGETAPPPVAPVLDAAGSVLVDAPETPFVALHSAIALATSGDAARLAALARHCRGSRDVTIRTVVATVCDALLRAGEERWDDAVTLLEDTLPVLAQVGGSAAQREVVEETLLFCLVNAGHAERAGAVLDARLDRRESPLDARRRDSLVLRTTVAG
ncbi:FAD/NAD(P)-binding protein [Mumia sp. zg.B53]|uniref:FAD/NAD(P)-binding protein n=1 Tax=Mumia sp. zg.B53 TaxID=2855449 RepID=UPI001C6E45F5|nr:FAD/NAD(P)-binding protein [Mumia sp. zg.B53]MBW9215570.1 FAD/NAD(P)-binding protein [Mumia sp. zg.B53]